MSGAVGSVAALAEHLVHIEVGHVVSSSSMVSRAYLADDCVGVVVDAGERGLWLVSSLPALAPAPDGLRVRAAEKGGIPVEAGTPRLVKITLRWGESSVELKNPTVVGSDGIGIVSLAVPASFGAKLRSGEGPRPVDVAGVGQLRLGDEVAILIGSPTGAMVRWARVASDPGFGGVENGLAIDRAVSADHSGSPLFALKDAAASFCGIVQPVDDQTALLLPTAALRDAIPG